MLEMLDSVRVRPSMGRSWSWVEEFDAAKDRRAGVRERYYGPELPEAENRYDSALEVWSLESIIRETEAKITRPIVSSLLYRVIDETVATPQQFRNIATSGGTDASPDGDNEITIPTGYTGVILYVGDLPLSAAYANLYVEINGVAEDPVKVIRYQSIHIRAEEGAVVSINATYRNGSGTSNLAKTNWRIVPIMEPESLAVPMGVTGTVNCDKSGVPVWSPSGTAHVVLPAENGTLKINAASGRRNLFIVERDPSGNLSGVRAIHVPDNTAMVIQCRHREVFFANFTGSTISVTSTVGTTIGGTSREYRPAFTAARTVEVSTPAELAAALTTGTVADGDDIVLATGSYDLSSAGHVLTYTNFGGSSASAMGKNIRLRGETGDPTDVVITGAATDIDVRTGVRWVIEAIEFSLAGVGVQPGMRGLLDIDGRCDIHKVNVIGPGTGTAANLALRTTVGDVTVYVSYCLIQGSVDDGLNTDQTTGNHVCYVIGGTIDGNGDNTTGSANKQTLTSHSGATIVACGVTFTDAAAPTYRLYITADAATSPIYLWWCACLAAGVTHADGLQFASSWGVNGIHFCEFTALNRALVTDYAVGCRLIQKASSGIRLIPSVTSTYTPVFLGCYCQGDDTAGSGYDCTDLRYSCELIGCYFESQSTNPSLMLGASNPATAQVLTIVGCTVKTGASSTLISAGTHANISGTLTNCVFDANTSNGAIVLGASGGVFTLSGSYLRRSSQPTNWDAKMEPDWASITSTGNTVSTSAAALGADLIPTDAGNCDASGVDPGFIGGIDIYGRPLYLGAAWCRGGAERQEIRTGALLFPMEWV